jgi:cyclophilin family peptidyl-prolyl cis-trans isomerase
MEIKADMRTLIHSVLLLTLVTLVAAIATTVAADDLTGTPAEICAEAVPADEPGIRTYDEPEQVLEAGVDYRAIFCTDSGPVYVNLFEDFTPQTVNSFVFLAQNGFYNNTTFHRVLVDFMAQGGDPTGTGGGGPGYNIDDEFLSFLHFDRPGLLAMANANQPEQGIFNTKGSQFFLTTAITNHLNYRHTIFGEVLEGQENVEALQLRNPQEQPDHDGSALHTVVIITDPDAVVSDYEALETATQDDMLEAMGMIGELPGVVLDEGTTGVFSTAEVVSAAPEAIRAAYEDFLIEAEHQYSVTMVHANVDCDLTVAPFGSISYTIHVFASPDAARAAMEDLFLPDFLTAGGEFVTEDSPFSVNPLYISETTVCDLDGIDARMVQKYGRFITVAESALPVESPFDADIWLDQVVKFQVYELIFSDVLRRETTQ